jgi:ABC-type transport system, involved in lipoprotein release, permease component
LNSLAARHPNIKFYKQYFTDITIANYSRTSETLFQNFIGFTEVDDMSNLGYQTLYGSSRPNNSRSVIISRYAAEALLKGKVFKDADELSETIGGTFSAGGYDVILSGIYETDYEPYLDPNDNQIIDAYNSVFQLFVGKDSGFMENYLAYILQAKSAGIKVVIEGEDDLFNFDYNNPIVVKDTSSLPNFLNADKIELAPAEGETRKEIYLVLPSNIDLNRIAKFNESNDAYFIIGKQSDYPLGSQNNYYYDYPDYYGYFPGNIAGSIRTPSDLTAVLSSADYYIAGYYLCNRTAHYGVALDEETYGGYIGGYLKTRQIMLVLSDSEKENAALVKDLIDNDMQLNANFSFLFTIYLAMFLNFKKLIIGVAAFLCVFATVLMYNFISTSIRLTKRNIGLMRALGAKKFHTFLVYVMEGLCVGVLTAGVSSILLSIIIPAVNLTLSAVVNVYLPVMVANPLVFLSTAGLGILVSVAATFVPWFKFSRITPIDAIISRTE